MFTLLQKVSVFWCIGRNLESRKRISAPQRQESGWLNTLSGGLKTEYKILIRIRINIRMKIRMKMRIGVRI